MDTSSHFIIATGLALALAYPGHAQDVPETQAESVAQGQKANVATQEVAPQAIAATAKHFPDGELYPRIELALANANGSGKVAATVVSKRHSSGELGLAIAQEVEESTQAVSMAAPE